MTWRMWAAGAVVLLSVGSMVASFAGAIDYAIHLDLFAILAVLLLIEDRIAELVAKS